MKLRPRHLPTLLLAAVLLVLAVRVVWVANTTETGWSVLRTNWCDATLGWVLGKYQPIGQREPTDQADYWLAETDRILAAHPDDAQLAMGAAWLLDSPGQEFVQRHLKVRDFMGGLSHEVDQAAVGRATDAFDAKTPSRCLELAARATRLEPDNVDWWRGRALLLFPERYYGGSEVPPRDPAWLDVLAECARHDPDNALYDYLAAVHFWERAAEIIFDTEDPTLRIHDAEAFERGNDFFRKGLLKRQLAGGTAANAVALALLEHSRVPCNQWPRIARDRLQGIREVYLFRALQQRPDWQASTRLASGSTDGVIELLRQPLRVFEQADAAGDQWPYEECRLATVQVAFFPLRAAIRKHPALVSKEELVEIERQHEAALVDMKLFAHACQRANARRAIPQPASAIPTLAWSASLNLFGLLAGVALILWAAGWLLMRPRLPWRPHLGLLRNAACWATAFGVTFLVLGVAPAGLIAPQVQRWILAGVLLAALAWGCRLWYTRRRLQFTIRTMLWATLAVAGLATLVTALLHDDPQLFTRILSGTQMTARGIGPFEAAAAGIAVGADAKPWEWAIWQWTSYQGPYVTFGVGLLLVAGWFLRMRRRGTEDEVAQYRAAPRRARFGAMSDCLARSALGLAGCLLAVYLALTPSMLPVSEADYQFYMTYLRDPTLGEREVLAVMDEIRADVPVMESLRADAKAQIESELAEESAQQEPQ